MRFLASLLARLKSGVAMAFHTTWDWTFGWGWNMATDAIENTFDAMQRSWKRTEAQNPNVAQGLRKTGRFAREIGMLPLRLLAGDGSGAHSVPNPSKTPTKTINLKPEAKKSARDIPIEGAESLMSVIEYLRAEPQDRRRHRLQGLDKFEKAVFYDAFTGNHNTDRMKQLAGMKDHEILQLFKKTVSDERVRLQEQKDRDLKGALSLNSGSLHSGDVQRVTKRMEATRSRAPSRVKGEVMEMPRKSAMTTATTSSVFGADLLAQVSERTRQMTADRQMNFLQEESENPAAGLTRA